jgi:transposase
VGTRRKFSKEFKQDAVELVTVKGHDLVEVARDLGIRPDNLRRWKRKFEEDGEDAFPGSGRRKPEDEEMHQTGSSGSTGSDSRCSGCVTSWRYRGVDITAGWLGR